MKKILIVGATSAIATACWWCGIMCWLNITSAWLWAALSALAGPGFGATELDAATPAGLLAAGSLAESVLHPAVTATATR